MAIWGALIGAAASLLGGRKSNKSADRAARMNLEQQKEFAQHGVRWRVEDAKAAGLHPLYALGANVPSFSPISVQDSMGPAIADAGQQIGRAVSAQQTAQEREAAALGLQVLRSQIAESDARRGLLDAQTARELQEANQAQTFPYVDPQGGVSLTSDNMGSQFIKDTLTRSVPPGITELKPTQTPTISSMDPSGATGAGVAPMWREFQLGNGMKMVLPGGMQGDASESLESLAESPLLMWAVLNENERRYGKGWKKEFAKRYGFSMLPTGPDLIETKGKVLRFLRNLAGPSQ